MKMDRKTTRGISDDNTGERSESKSNGNRLKRKKPSDIQFANIIEKINEGFVILDAQMNYTYINQRGSELLKREPEDLIGKSHWDEYPEDKNTSFGQAYLRALETQTPIEFEDYYAPGDRWLQNRIFPFENGLSIFFNDITERKRTELVLTEFGRQHEALYKLTDRLQRTKSLEDVFDAALDAIQSALQCDRASILLFDDSNVMHFVAWRGLSDDYRKATDGHSPWKPDEKNPEPISMNDIRTAELSDSLRAVIEKEGISSLAFIPLVFNGRLIGKFMVYFNDPHVFSEDQVELSLTIARQLAVSIERKQDENALRTSEEHLRLATRAAGMFAWEFDIQEQTSIVADNFIEALGFSAGLIPKNKAEILQRLIHPEDTQLILEVLTKAIKDHSDLRSVQFRILNPENGQPIWLEVNGKVVYDSAGNPERMFGVAQNITESKQTEEYIRYLNTELQAQLDEMNTLMKILPTGVWIGNHDCSEITGNPAAYQLLGFESGINVSVTNPEPQVPTGLRIFVNSEEILPEDAPMQVVARSGKPWHGFEHELLFLDGTRKSIYGSVVPLFDEHGAVRKVIASYTDFTERKRMEDERDQLLEREQAQRASAEQAKIEAEQARVEAERELAERRLAEAALGEWADAPLPQDKRPAWLRYAAAIVATLIAVLIRALFNPVLGDALALVTIYGAVAFSVWYGGVGPAILSVVLGYVAITGLIIEPRHVFLLNAQNVTGLALFLFSNTVVMALGETMRRAQRHAHQSARVAIERQHQAETQLFEKQRAEESLRQSEALYRGIARSIPGGGVYVVDKDFRYLVAEGPVTKAFGLSREMLEGRTVSESFPKEPAERMVSRLQRNFAGETVDFETSHNGRVYWTQQAPMADSLGNIDNAIIMTIDITERKQVEEALRRSEERFARFMQHLPGLAWIKDTEGRYVYANAAAEKAFRTPREKLYGRTDEEIFPAEVAAQFRKNDELALMDEKSVQVTETLEHEDGVLHYSLVNKFPIPGPDGSTALIGGTAFDITERKQAEEALRESEARLRAVFDGTYEYIGLLAPDGTLLEANRAALEFDNDTRADVVGRPFWETSWWLYTPGAPEALRQAIAQAARGEFIRYEAPLNRRSGETMIFDFSLHPVLDEQGQVIFLVPEGRNITERKMTEEMLRESEERFHAILRQATAGIVRKDAEGRFVFVNQAFCNMLGYSESELLGKTIWDFTHQDDLEENKKLYERTMIEGVPFKLEKRLIRADGSTMWVDVSVSPIMDATGKPQSAVAVEVDITRRKQAEELLRESERRFREMIDALPTAIYTTDAEGRLTHFNPAAAEFSGRVPELGNDQWCVTWKLYYPDGTPMPHDQCPMAIALREGREVRGVEAIAERPDGRRIWFEPYPTPLRDSEGRIVGGINMLVDITERKQAEEALQQLNLQLENRVEKRTVELQAANQSLRDEIAERLKVEDALHESRKRLQILSQRLVDVQEEERRAIARELHDSVGQSLSALNINLVILDNQISNYATQQIRTRMDDSIQLVSETITLVRDVMSDLRPPVLDDYGLEAALQSHVDAFKTRYGIGVQFEKSDQLIPRLGPSIEMTFLRIAQEALINVARHAKAEKVTLSLTRDEKVVRLVVQDNGTGIASWQDANRPGSHGLTIMRERAEALGGNLRVSSMPGEGTKVEASIPIEDDSQSHIQKET